MTYEDLHALYQQLGWRCVVCGAPPCQGSLLCEEDLDDWNRTGQLVRVNDRRPIFVQFVISRMVTVEHPGGVL